MSDEKKVSRRDFLQALGAVGTVGAASVVGIPALDKIQSDADKVRPTTLKGRPFYVKEVDELTLGMGEIREEYERWDIRRDCFHSLNKYVGETEFERLNKLEKDNTQKWLEEGRPGYSIRDRALANGANLLNMSAGPFGGEDVGIQGWQAMPWTNGLRASGVKYKESAEIAARDVKAAARLYGAALVGVVELDKRMVYDIGGSGKPIVFEDVEQPYSDEEKYVLPSSFKWAVVMAHAESAETHYRAPSALGGAAVRLGYSEMTWTSASLAEFIRGLGYEAVPTKNGFTHTPWIAAQAGLGELGRMNRLVTPEYGPMVRLSVVLTNLPMVADKPIDAGIADFCVSCKKCAEACPSGALSFEDEPFWETRGEWNASGHKAWFPDSEKCLSYWREITTGCGTCVAACPWSKKDEAWLHGLVRTTASATPLLNGFMREMDDVFYPVKNDDEAQEAWWDLELPAYGIDTMQAADEV